MRLSLLAALAVVAPPAWAAGVGGYMSGNGCYTGNGFVTGRVCQTAQAEATVASPSIKVVAKATGSYKDRSGSSVAVKVEVWVNDYQNFYNPEATLPVLVRGIVCRFHRDCAYKVVSLPRTFKRITGQRVLRGSFSMALSNSFGSEDVERLEKIEVLLPGVPGVLTLRF